VEGVTVSQLPPDCVTALTVIGPLDDTVTETEGGVAEFDGKT
jgi:hypothetical protein